MKRRALWALLAALALVVAACGGDGGEETTTTADGGATTTEAAEPTTTEAMETTTTAGETQLGTEERPVQVLFVPSVDSQVIVSGGDIMDDFLTEATGLEFDVSVPTSYAATIEEMCAAPADTMGFIPGFGYVLASQLCGVDVSFKAIRFGYGVYWSQILVPRDSDIESIEDLDPTMTWAVPDLGSTSGYLVPLLQLDEAGIEIPEENILPTGGHPNAALAVYRGEADFATTFFSPPLITEGEPWEIGDPPQVPEDLVEQCAPDEEGDLYCGENFRVLDARASATTDAPDIIQATRILEISPEIPNDTLSFGPDFPEDIRSQIEDALVEFAAECETNEDCAWNQSIGNQDFYGWTGIEPATDAEYDPLRQVVDIAGIELEDL